MLLAVESRGRKLGSSGMRGEWIKHPCTFHILLEHPSLKRRPPCSSSRHLLNLCPSSHLAGPRLVPSLTLVLGHAQRGSRDVSSCLRFKLPAEPRPWPAGQPAPLPPPSSPHTENSIRAHSRALLGGVGGAGGTRGAAASCSSSPAGRASRCWCSTGPRCRASAGARPGPGSAGCSCRGPRPAPALPPLLPGEETEMRLRPGSGPAAPRQPHTAPGEPAHAPRGGATVGPRTGAPGPAPHS